MCLYGLIGWVIFSCCGLQGLLICWGWVAEDRKFWEWLGLAFSFVVEKEHVLIRLLCRWYQSVAEMILKRNERLGKGYIEDEFEDVIPRGIYSPWYSTDENLRWCWGDNFYMDKRWGDRGGRIWESKIWESKYLHSYFEDVLMVLRSCWLARRCIDRWSRMWTSRYGTQEKQMRISESRSQNPDETYSLTFRKESLVETQMYLLKQQIKVAIELRWIRNQLLHSIVDKD